MVQVRRSLLAGRGEGTRLPARGDQRGIPQDAAGCRQVLRRGRIVSSQARFKSGFRIRIHYGPDPDPAF